MHDRSRHQIQISTCKNNRRASCHATPGLVLPGATDYSRYGRECNSNEFISFHSHVNTLLRVSAYEKAPEGKGRKWMLFLIASLLAISLKVVYETTHSPHLLSGTNVLQGHLDRFYNNNNNNNNRRHAITGPTTGRRPTPVSGFGRSLLHHSFRWDQFVGSPSRLSTTS